MSVTIDVATGRWDDAASSLSPKLEQFHAALSVDEQVVLALALRGSGNEVDGYRVKQDPAVVVRQLPIWDGLQKLVAAIAAPVNTSALSGASTPYSPNR